MKSIYDAVGIGTSLVPQAITGSSAVDGANAVDTKGYNTALVHVYAAQVTSAGSAASLAVTLQESADGSTNWANALDNTGTVIGFTLNVQSADAYNSARIEGLGLNRKRYLRVVITPTYVGGSPSSIAYGAILLGRAFTNPVRTAVSNT